MSKVTDMLKEQNQTTPKQTGVRDEAAPKFLTVTIMNENGDVLGNLTAPAKEFKTGSVGFYAGEKMTNPKSGKRYQVSMSVTLIGSKPAA
jgi:hypothetical protein